MKPNHRTLISSAVLTLALAGVPALAETITNVVPRPGAIQPGGDANDTTRNFGMWWSDTGTVTEDLDFTMHSRADIAASLHVVYDCPGAAGEKSANLAFGNFFSSLWGDNNWLGAANTFDAAKFQSLNFDIFINNSASSNTSLSITLWGYGYENVALTNLPLTLSGWQHLEIPIPATINLPNCVGYGIYDWYNTTATTPPAHVEYWMDNVMLVARSAGPPPPTLAIAPVTDHGLLFDSGPAEGGQRGAIDSTVDVRWSGYATPGSPVTYSMTISKVPDSAIYSNYEAHIFLAPTAGVGNPDWNLSDMGYLQILNHNDGTATARMMWKTNDPMANDMLFGAGTLGYLDASSMTGTWSITFTSDTDMVVRGPGDVSASYSLPLDWVNNYNNLGGGNVYAYFGGSPNGNNNAGQPMYLSRVSISGASAGYNYTNDFTNPVLDSTRWALLGNETVQVPSSSAWWLSWTLPAAGFDLWAKESLSTNTPWIRLSGNTNLPVPVTTYSRGGEMRALVAGTSLPNSSHTFFAARKLVASKLQVLMPGETNAPFTATGKIGTPTAQLVGNYVTITVNAVDPDWNIVTGCTDTVHLTSADASATLPADAALANGTGNFDVLFGTTGSQTVTASDISTPAVSSGTSSGVSITNP